MYLCGGEGERRRGGEGTGDTHWQSHNVFVRVLSCSLNQGVNHLIKMQTSKHRPQLLIDTYVASTWQPHALTLYKDAL